MGWGDSEVAGAFKGTTGLVSFPALSQAGASCSSSFQGQGRPRVKTWDFPTCHLGPVLLPVPGLLYRIQLRLKDNICYGTLEIPRYQLMPFG